jgi:hypothetical protein
MKTFRDTAGRDWAITVNYSAKERVLEYAKVDLFDLKVFENLGNDPTKIIDVLYAVCKPDLDTKGLTKAQFVDAIAGDVIAEASDALTSEIIDFFPQRRREMLTKIRATAEKVQDKALAMIDEKINSGELQRKLEQSLNDAFGVTPESSVSTPAPSPSVSSQ